MIRQTKPLFTAAQTQVNKFKMSYASTLSTKQRMANTVFFEHVFQQLKDGGTWMGDDGSMKRCGEKFLADNETYKMIRKATTASWFKRRVILFMNLAG